MWPLPDDCWREPWARYVPRVDRLPLWDILRQVPSSSAKAVFYPFMGKSVRSQLSDGFRRP